MFYALKKLNNWVPIDSTDIHHVAETWVRQFFSSISTSRGQCRRDSFGEECTLPVSSEGRESLTDISSTWWQTVLSISSLLFSLNGIKVHVSNSRLYPSIRNLMSNSISWVIHQQRVASMWTDFWQTDNPLFINNPRDGVTRQIPDRWAQSGIWCTNLYKPL